MRWPFAADLVISDIRDQMQSIGAPDLVLFTGDLAYRGARSDYAKVDETIEEIRECIGPAPVLVTVPGNHDLTRPSSLDLEAIAAKEYFTRKDVRDGFVKGHKASVEFFSSMFAEYHDWWKRTIRKDWLDRSLRFQEGVLPGDFLLTIEKGGLRLGIAGMNSAFLHFFDADEEGVLALECEQLAAVTNLPRWRNQHDAALLLMHHPRAALHPESRQILTDAIYPGEAFTACYFGHMHANKSETTIVGGSDTRRWIQGASLFGLEYFRGTETRSVGYAWGQLRRVDEQSGVLTRWPRAARPKEDGSFAFFPGDIKPYPHTESVRLRAPRHSPERRVGILQCPPSFRSPHLRSLGASRGFVPTSAARSYQPMIRRLPRGRSIFAWSSSAACVARGGAWLRPSARRTCSCCVRRLSTRT